MTENKAHTVGRKTKVTAVRIHDPKRHKTYSGIMAKDRSWVFTNKELLVASKRAERMGLKK
jgi:hypothetical protein